ncbi:LRP16 protein [Operophtera brumata]|uniref:LRP16 protein n=1 Tax=Operophtera brumata TaxID=104452 RepID=A0A0L7L9V7_OPEBR|nr:LRP16 protein [Operophtera brumata]
MTSQPKWKIEKKKILSMPIQEKRQLYKSADFVILDKVDPWFKYVVLNKGIEAKKHTLEDLNEFRKIKLDPSKNKVLSEKIDCIVNAANSQLRAGGDIIHTVGPQDGSPSKLQSCYENCFATLTENSLTTIAFPCICTGIYGFPNRLAAHIALRNARRVLEANEELSRVIFCTFMPLDVDIYETLMQMYFPVHGWNYNDGASVSE